MELLLPTFSRGMTLFGAAALGIFLGALAFTLTARWQSRQGA